MQELLDYARLIERHRSAAAAVEIRLSTIRGHVTEGNVLFAINMFRSLVDQNEGRLFVLDNSDLVFVYRGQRVQDVRSAVERLRLLYSEQLLGHEDSRGGRAFVAWYNLNDEPESLRRAMEQRAGSEAPARAPVRPTATIARPGQAEGSAVTLERLVAAVDALERVKIRPMLRRQPVVQLPAGGVPVEQFQELYISIPDIELAVCPGGRLTGDRWLFQYFTQLLDRRMLLYLRDSDDPELTGKFSLNLNISSILSPEFRPFSEILSDAARTTVMIEFQKTDVFSDPGSYFYARDMIRERGFKVGLDAVTEVSLPLVDAPRLGLDFLKLRWNPELGAEGLERCRHDLARPQLRESCRIVLCRVDSMDGLAFGHSAEIDLFQGRHFDQLPYAASGRGAAAPPQE